MSQTTRQKSEFLGLHDPYAELPPGTVVPPRPTTPLVTREQAGELGRAGISLLVLFVAVAAVVIALR